MQFNWMLVRSKPPSFVFDSRLEKVRFRLSSSPLVILSRRWLRIIQHPECINTALTIPTPPSTFTTSDGGSTSQQPEVSLQLQPRAPSSPRFQLASFATGRVRHDTRHKVQTISMSSRGKERGGHHDYRSCWIMQECQGRKGDSGESSWCQPSIRESYRQANIVLDKVKKCPRLSAGLVESPQIFNAKVSLTIPSLRRQNPLDQHIDCFLPLIETDSELLFELFSNSLFGQRLEVCSRTNPLDGLLQRRLGDLSGTEMKRSHR
jgi:hypothetical protein